MVYPPLWSHISFTAHPDSYKWVTDIFLPRSGRHPLDVTVHPFDYNRLLRRVDDEALSMCQALRILLPHCARWSKLCISPRDEIDLDDTISVPLLHHIEIICRGPDGEEFEDMGLHRTSHMPSFNLGAPVLASIRLLSPCIQCGTSLINLTLFEFDAALLMVTLTQPELESIAAASPALRALRLRLRRFEASGGTITIHSLRELSLNCRGCAYSMRLFACIHAPTLETLELIFLQDRDLHTMSPCCLKFPDYPRPQTLKLFSVLTTRMSSGSYDTLFHVFPAITTLYINHTSTFIKPALNLSQLLNLRSLTYNCWSHSTEYLDCVQWILRHVQDCHGTPHAMKSIRIG